MVTDNLCMGCMNEIGEQKKCPYCGFSADTPQLSPYLPYHTILNNRYHIGKVIASGGDGVTYMAWDADRETAVTVREFLPMEHIQRAQNTTTVICKDGSALIFKDGMHAFLMLWRKLARLKNLSALMPVYDIFEENGTAYAVSEYVESITLREFLLKSRTGSLNWEQAKALLMPVLTTLASLHEVGIYHLGISPNTLILGRNGKLRLTGYMISDARLTNTDLNAELMSGYAPLEQYDPEGKVGAWSDIYAFTAVTYRTLIGSTPNDATERAANDKLMIPANFIEMLPAYLVSALQNGLELHPEDRIKTAEDLREQLSGSPSTMEINKSHIEKVTNTAEDTSDADLEERKQKEKERRAQAKKEAQTKTLLISFAVCVSIGLLILGIVGLIDRIQQKQTTEDPTANLEMVAVPNFRGESYSRISSDEVQNKRFTFEVKYEYSEEVEVGYIIDQSVGEGQEVPKGSRLVLTVSQGTEYISIPNCSGKDFIFAEADLKRLGLVVTKVEKENDGTHTAGEVITTTPGVDSHVATGTEVFVQVWGPVPTTAPSGNSFFGDLFGGGNNETTTQAPLN